MKRAVLLAIMLGGCDVTASQERATAERVDTADCSNYGFRPGSVEFAQCRMSKDQQRQAGYRAAIDQTDRNNRETAESLERMLIKPTINCTGVSNGNTTSTTCR